MADAEQLQAVKRIAREAQEGQEAQEAQEARVLADFAAAATCTTLCCAGLVSSIEATMRAHALRIYRRDR